VRFEWDEDKASGNLRKHGVAFEDAARVFLDPLALREQDRVVDGEERWQIIGTLDAFKLVVVAHTTRDDPQGEEIIRIISSRKAERHERRQYEDGA
jgi:uncharacterized DUF497 family protein